MRGGTVNQLKKTSDCIKIDPPGPGRSLEKSQKKSTAVIQGGRWHRSLNNQKRFQIGRTPEGGGGDRAKRSSTSAAPSAARRVVNPLWKSSVVNIPYHSSDFKSRGCRYFLQKVSRGCHAREDDRRPLLGLTPLGPLLSAQDRPKIPQ